MNFNLTMLFIGATPVVKVQISGAPLNISHFQIILPGVAGLYPLKNK